MSAYRTNDYKVKSTKKEKESNRFLSLIKAFFWFFVPKTRWKLVNVSKALKCPDDPNKATFESMIYERSDFFFNTHKETREYIRHVSYPGTTSEVISFFVREDGVRVIYPRVRDKLSDDYWKYQNRIVFDEVFNREL